MKKEKRGFWQIIETLHEQETKEKRVVTFDLRHQPTQHILYLSHQCCSLYFSELDFIHIHPKFIFSVQNLA